MTCLLKLQTNPDDHYIFQLSGELNFDSIVPIIKEASDYFEKPGKITVDLADITYVNSAGIALLLEWNYRTRMIKKQYQIINMPDKLINIARVCDVDTILFETS